MRDYGHETLGEIRERNQERDQEINAGMTSDDLDQLYEEEEARKRGETGECISSPANEEDNDPDNADDPDYGIPREPYYELL